MVRGEVEVEDLDHEGGHGDAHEDRAAIVDPEAAAAAAASHLRPCAGRRAAAPQWPRGTERPAAAQRGRRVTRDGRRK